MTRKTLIGLVLVLGLLGLVGTAALAQGPGFWGHMGYGYGHWGAYNGPEDEFVEGAAELRNDLYRKRAELEAVLAAPELNEAKASALQAEINQLENELAQKRLTAELEWRKKNPDRRRGYGPGDRFYGWGHGPGACWR